MRDNRFSIPSRSLGFLKNLSYANLLRNPCDKHTALLIVEVVLVPPVGIFDGCLLTAVGLLLMFSVIEKIPEAFKAEKSIKVRKGDSSVEITTSEPTE